MRILLANDYAVPTAGAEIMLLGLRDNLRARGHEVRVFASDAELIPGPSFADWTCRGTTTRMQALTSTWNWSARRALRKAIAEFRPDLVHIKMFLWQLSPAILSELRDVPAIYHIVTFKPICPNGRKLLPDGTLCRSRAGVACLTGGCLTPQTWLPMMLQQRLWRRRKDAFDAFITPSHAMKRWLEAEGVSPVEVIANGCARRAMRPPLSGDPVIAFAGRLSHEKGVDVLLRAFAAVRAEVPAARLWIAGAGPEAKPLQELARALHVDSSVEFLGALPFAEMDRRFERAWVQVVPSIWDEPFGMVVIEAGMRGTAVVASRSGGPGEIVRDGESGVLCAPGDERAWADALLRLVRDRALCESLGARGHEICEAHYSVDAEIERFEALYERVLNGANAR